MIGLIALLGASLAVILGRKKGGSPFTDNFNRANGGLGANWNSNVGTGDTAPQILSNAVHGTGTSNASGRLVATASTADYYAELTANLGIAGGGLGGGPSIRDVSTVGSDTYYFAYFADNGNLVVYKRVANTITSIGTAVVGPLTGTIRLEAAGTTIKASLNGSVVVTVTDASIAGAGRPGLYVDKGDFDNFVTSGVLV